MKIFSLFLLAVLFSCEQKQKESDVLIDNQKEFYNSFEEQNHLQPVLDKIKFDTSHGSDFCWALLEPINIASDTIKEKELSKRLSPEQKALYFFWYLDAEVTNGGFIQFYWNDNRKYILPIKKGLKLIGDSTLLAFEKGRYRIRS